MNCSGIFKSALKDRMNSSTSTSKTSQNAFPLAFTPLFASFGIRITYSISLMLQGNYNFLECSEKSNFKLQTENVY